MDNWLSYRLIKWYSQNKRDLPWRHETDPYKIWLSEIILQQTQVAQGLSYYHKFVNEFPDVRSLAKAPEDKVLKLWQGLGYYSRARNLHHSAKMVLGNFKGKFPDNYLEIRQLKGVGDYTAAAISSFAFGLPHAVVDGNVFRLLSRLFNINTAIDSSRGKKEFFDLAQNLLNVKNPALHNQAIMEFGSQYCKPTNPDCGACIFKDKCLAHALKKTKALPVKEKKTKVKKRHFNYVVVSDNKRNILLRKRAANDIWKGLYEFILIETKTSVSTQNVMSGKEFASIFGRYTTLIAVSKTYKHILSHQQLMARFYIVKTSGFNRMKITGEKVQISQLDTYAFPRLIEKFLNDYELGEIL